MKRSQLLILILAVVAVAGVALVSKGGGGDDGGDGGETAPAAPEGAIAVPFAYSPEKRSCSCRSSGASTRSASR